MGVITYSYIDLNASLTNLWLRLKLDWFDYKSYINILRPEQNGRNFADDI